MKSSWNPLLYVDIQEIFRWIDSVPNVIWSGVIAAVITLIGVLISNRGNTLRLHQQHQHEADQKRKERITNIRRELYLQVAADMGAALARISEFPTLDLRKENLVSSLIALNTTAAKCQLIAEQETARLLSNVVALIADLTHRKMVKAQEIFAFTLEAEHQESLRDEARRQSDALIEEQKQVLDAEKFDDGRFTMLSDFYKQALARVAEHSSLMLEAGERKLDLQIEFSFGALTDSEAILIAQIPLAVAFRKELELETDANALMQRSREGFKRQQQTLYESMQALQALRQKDASSTSAV